MKYFYMGFVFCIIAVVSVLGFRGQSFEKPPLRIFPDMDNQSKYKPQASSAFFTDGRTDRLPVQGTVARGYWGEDDHLWKGMVNGEYAKGFPVELTREFVEHGRERFAIYCTPCHGGLGDGNGVTKSRGIAITPTYHSDRIRNMPEGQIFETITQGFGQMPSYADKLSVEERWAIIAWVRVLQRSQQASVEDVPQENRKDLGL